jgi:hypothetical protein
MTRSFHLLGLLMMLFVPACTEPPKPCTGDSCPKPVVCEANPGIAKQTSGKKGLTATTTFTSCYRQGASATAAFTLKATDESIIPTDRVDFRVDIVVLDSQRNANSVLSDFFSSEGDISISPDIFRNGASKAELIAGINSTINFKFKSNSPVGGGPYYLVISLAKAGSDPFDGTAVIGRIAYQFTTGQ